MADRLTIVEIREDLDNILEWIREERNDRDRGVGARELSEAITNFETACMWLNRAYFAESDYSPIINED